MKNESELTIRGLLLGAVIAAVFTAANIYLGLRVGLTIASSIPAAVISMGVLRAFRTGTIKSAQMAPAAVVSDLVTGQLTPFGIAVDEARGRLYWLQLDLNKKKTERNAIRAANLAGGEVETVLERPGAGDRLDPYEVRAYATGTERGQGGFHGGLWDTGHDVEYTFYGLGSLALLNEG